MPSFRSRSLFYSLFFSFLFLACQRPLAPTVQLPPDTDIKVDASIPANPQTEALIGPYRQQLAQRMNEVLGQTTQELRKVDGRESALGNFVADVQLAQALPLYKKPIDMSLTTTGGIRATLPAGNITLSNLFELSPFENQLVVATLPGAIMQKLFEYGASQKNLVISNASFTIKDNKPGNIIVAGKPFSPQQSYKVVLSDYLVNGGDDLFFLKEATAVEPVGILVREALIKHIRELTAQHKVIESRVENRIKVL